IWSAISWATATAHDDQFDVEALVGEPADRLDHRTDALARNQAADAQHPEPSPSLLAVPVGREVLEVDPAGDHGDVARRHAELLQLEGLVGAGRHDRCGAPSDIRFQ